LSFIFVDDHSLYHKHIDIYYAEEEEEEEEKEIVIISNRRREREQKIYLVLSL
jgi:hypothetical protein